jgi:hypothetical protein
MCLPGNQSIYLKELGKNHARTHEMRAVLAKYGGCMTNGKVDMRQKAVLEVR